MNPEVWGRYRVYGSEPIEPLPLSRGDYHPTTTGTLTDVLEVDLPACWNDWLGANTNLDQFLEQQALPQSDTHLIWAMDEVDRMSREQFFAREMALRAGSDT